MCSNTDPIDTDPIDKSKNTSSDPLAEWILLEKTLCTGFPNMYWIVHAKSKFDENESLCKIFRRQGYF